MNVIFVCTGNTCRSPMAEYYLKSKNLNDVSVKSRGFRGGDSANEKSIAVMKEVGIDISNHISKNITADEVQNADAIICMTESHRQMLLLYGADNSKLYVLGDGIADPFGRDIDTYRTCRDEIFSNIDKLIENSFFSQVTVSVANIDDVKDIANIENNSFSTPWSEKAIRESMDAGTIFYVACLNNKIVGYMGLSKIVGEGYVTNIAVLPEYRRLGIGEKILGYVIDNTKAELEFISLEVRVSNIAAISLYEKFGFERTGLRKRFYTNPQEDAIIMTKYFN